MTMSAEEIEKLILDGISDARVRIEDLRGDGDHYAAYIESPAFIGKSRVDQHKMVFDAIKGKMDNDLHALAIQTSLPKNT